MRLKSGENELLRLNLKFTGSSKKKRFLFCHKCFVNVYIIFVSKGVFSLYSKQREASFGRFLRFFVKFVLRHLCHLRNLFCVVCDGLKQWFSTAALDYPLCDSHLLFDH